MTGRPRAAAAADIAGRSMQPRGATPGATSAGAGEDLSITNRAYVEIRAALVSCRLKPGSRLKIAQLQRDIGVSQAAVREALSRLTAEGLATIERNSGFRAAPISAEGYRELADACITIEVPLLRSSIANGDFGWEGTLLSTYHVASRVLAEVGEDPISMDSYVEHREQFHRHLFSACSNHWLLWAWSLLYTQQLRYRHTFRQLARFERGLHKDYRNFIDVVIERDVEAAVELWCDNHEKVVQFIEANLHSEAAEIAQTDASVDDAVKVKGGPRAARSSLRAST